MTYSKISHTVTNFRVICTVMHHGSCFVSGEHNMVPVATFREGPLGEGGNFELHEFFRLHSPCRNIFSYARTFFPFWATRCAWFFPSIFPCINLFCTSFPPPLTFLMARPLLFSCQGIVLCSNCSLCSSRNLCVRNTAWWTGEDGYKGDQLC